MVIVGITDNINFCAEGLGETVGNTIWLMRSNYPNILSHEIGHVFDLADEYCSNQAGSRDSRCNDGDIQDDGSLTGDINYLDPALGCDPQEGGGCCELRNYNFNGGNDTCDEVNYGICCDGNLNSQGGVATMSFAVTEHFIPGPRGFDEHSIVHLDSLLQLNCYDSQRLQESGKVIDVDFTVYKNGTVTDHGLKLLNGEPDSAASEGSYTLEVVDVNGSRLYVTNVSVYFDYSGSVEAGVNYSSMVSETNSLFHKVPFIEGMHELRLLHDGGVLYSTELDFCNFNFVCGLTENFLSCPEDCPLNQNDGICLPYDDNICDPDCHPLTDQDCLKPEITSKPPRSALNGSLYSYQVQATSLDNDTINYSLLEAPAGMGISQLGLVQWNVTWNNSVRVTIEARDDDGWDIQSYLLRIFGLGNPCIYPVVC